MTLRIATAEEQRRHKHTFITVDPGLRHTGISLWRDGVLENTWLNLMPSKMSWCVASARQAALVHQLQEVEYDVEAMWIEFPIHMGSLVGGAAEVRGDTLKLAYLVGQLTQAWADGCGRRGNGAFIVPIPVNAWKGQLPKPVVNAQVIQILGRERCRGFEADVWDAVAIGLWVVGKFPLSRVDREKGGPGEVDTFCV